MVSFLEVDGTRLEVERIAGHGAAAGTTLVFLHEGLGCAGSWRELPAALAEATGCAALVYSRRGYGRSAAAPLPRAVTFMHEEARRVLPALLEAAGVDDVVLVGHSDGASIALLHAGSPESTRVRVRGFVLEAPHVFVEEMCVQAIAALRGAYAGSELQEKLRRRHDDADAMVEGWTDVWLHPEFRAWNIEGVLPDVKAPVLVIQGTADEYGTLAQVEAVCAQVQGSAERLILPAVGHLPHRDRPEEVLHAMSAFVRRLLG
ncbi:benzoate degradation ring-cleavage hydrolase [Chondromyces apiculatus DSM 436]|uniref:Benzoate degradation ring-cleavage hydrolase n=2 Tax=Chondromyces apiculatus TaxID=51 RepID=A0A017T2Q0_9BACT|nr:benzoate degradation ring-cleavage hydrolase [Chondromyces apiculatus DSM 436]